MTRRSRGREIALQVLYQIEQNPGAPISEIHRFINRRSLGEQKLADFTTALISGVREHQSQIDGTIQEVAENWRLDRMAAIDRNILRLGAYEVLFCPEIPAKVAINESLELAKRYSTSQSSRFVNGILDRVLQLNASAQGTLEEKDASEAPSHPQSVGDDQSISEQPPPSQVDSERETP